MVFPRLRPVEKLTDVLRANKVLSIRNVRGNSELDPVLVPGAPGIGLNVLAGVADALLVDLEPVTVTLILVGSTRSLGHVHETRTRVLHGGTDAKLHGKLGSSLDLGRLGLTGEGEGPLVAAEVGHVGGHVIAGVFPFGRVVLFGTGVGTNVLVGGGFLTVDDEGVEEVMGRY